MRRGFLVLAVAIVFVAPAQAQQGNAMRLLLRLYTATPPVTERFVAMSNMGMPAERTTMAVTGQDVYMSRQKVTFATGGADYVRAAMVGYMANGAYADVDLGRAEPVQMTFECPSLPVTTPQPMLFNGLSSGTIPSGAAILTTDALQATSFGVSSFAAGTVCYLRFESRGNSGLMLLDRPFVFSTDSSVNQAYYAPAGAASQLTATGLMTLPSGGTTAAVLPPIVAIIGHQTSAAPSILGVGDSVMAQVKDNPGDGNASGGFFQRAAFANSFGFGNIAVGGSTSVVWTASLSKRAVWFKYASHAITELGSNDIANYFGSTPSFGTNAAGTIANMKTIWASLAANGIVHIDQTAIIPRDNSSTDLTPIAGFAISDSGGRTSLNSLYAANVGSNGLAAFIDTSTSLQDVSFADRWSSGSITYDGVHPDSAGAPLMTTPLQTRMSGYTVP